MCLTRHATAWLLIPLFFISISSSSIRCQYQLHKAPWAQHGPQVSKTRAVSPPYQESQVGAQSALTAGCLCMCVPVSMLQVLVFSLVVGGQCGVASCSVWLASICVQKQVGIMLLASCLGFLLPLKPGCSALHPCPPWPHKCGIVGVMGGRRINSASVPQHRLLCFQDNSRGQYTCFAFCT